MAFSLNIYFTRESTRAIVTEKKKTEKAVEVSGATMLRVTVHRAPNYPYRSCFVMHPLPVTNPLLSVGKCGAGHLGSDWKLEMMSDIQDAYRSNSWYAVMAITQRRVLPECKIFISCIYCRRNMRCIASGLGLFWWDLTS